MLKNKMAASYLAEAATLIGGLMVLVSVAVGQLSDPGPGSNQLPQLMDRQKEIALALSACPQAVAEKAAVYVLEKSGYVKVRESENGFTAIVHHSQPTAQEPECMDAEGTRTIIPRYVKVAELRAQGKTPEEIKTFVAEAFAKGLFQPPARPGIDYMLSTEIVVVNGKGVIQHFPPHVMFYAPYLTNADVGSDGKFTSDVFVAGEGRPDALIIVPVGAHADHVATDKSGNSQ